MLTLLHGLQARTPGDFIRALLQAYGTGDEREDLLANPEKFRWRDLSKSLLGTKRSAPGPSCLLGTLTVEPKRRKVTQRQPKQKLAEVQAPTQREQGADEEEECKVRAWAVVVESVASTPCQHKACQESFTGS